MAANTDLITGLCEDVVLGEVVSLLCRLPWNERPLLTILNRTWFKVMTERFPVYDVALNNFEFVYYMLHTSLNNFEFVSRYHSNLVGGSRS
jgi:hypothetical protein